MIWAISRFVLFSGKLKPSAMLFVALGSPLATRGALLWDQSAAAVGGIGTIDQELSDLVNYSTYQVNDIKIDPPGWNVSGISTFFTKGWGAWAGITEARLSIFTKTGPLPDIGDRPWEGPIVDVSLIDRGDIWEARASGLSSTLTGGEEYWVGLTPIGEHGKVGNEFHLQAQDMVGDQAAWRDRGWSGMLWLVVHRRLYS